MNDGEIRLIASPLRYRLRPRALTVIVPAEMTDTVPTMTPEENRP